MNVVIWLDDVSKEKKKVDSSILSAKEITLINSLQDLDSTMFEDGQQRILIAFDGALQYPESVAELRMFKEILNLSVLFLLDVQNNEDMARSIGRVYCCNSSLLTFELIQAAVFQDNAYKTEENYLDKQISFARSILEDKNSTNELVQLSNYFLAAVSREADLRGKIDLLQNRLEIETMQNEILRNDNKRWAAGFKELESKVALQNNNLNKYETIFTQNVYVKLNLYEFPNKPVIVYLKTFTDFIGINKMIETITDVLRLQERLAVKVIQLFDNSGSRKMQLLPEYYHRLHNLYTMREVMNNTYLCKSGDYTNLMSRLLGNRYGLDVLLVVDSKDFDDTIFEGKTLQYNLCRTVAQAEQLALSQNCTVVNQAAEGWLTWAPAKVSGMSQSELLVRLGSRAVVKRIITDVERARNAVS